LFKWAKQIELPFGFIASTSLIFAGAIGNIIDSLFYGLIFEQSYGHVSAIFPEAGGYAGFLHGKVVDMFYFPLINGHYPDWVPFLGGNQFIFFRPVFNIADSAITVGIFSILIFYRKYFNKVEQKEAEEITEQNPETV
jgi:signal peptidase II